jgi:hypothetical protein
MPTSVINKKALTPSMQSPERVYFRKNDLVPAVPTGNNDDLGRETLYEPILVCSPVLASQRVHFDKSDKKEKKRLITADEVDDLTKQLNSMLNIVETPPVVKKNKAALSIAKTVGETATTTGVKPPALTPTTGRYDEKVFSPKAKGDVDVKRSFRLVRRAVGPE